MVGWRDGDFERDGGSDGRDDGDVEMEGASTKTTFLFEEGPASRAAAVIPATRRRIAKPRAKHCLRLIVFGSSIGTAWEA